MFPKETEELSMEEGGRAGEEDSCVKEEGGVEK